MTRSKVKMPMFIPWAMESFDWPKQAAQAWSERGTAIQQSVAKAA